ncbi:TPA: helix-turn-helix domain-containing protein [Citrobacter freundii]
MNEMEIDNFPSTQLARKPTEEILNLHHHLIPLSVKKTASAGGIIDNYIEGKYHVVLITKGDVTVCRCKDNIALGTALAPTVLGIVDACADVFETGYTTESYIISGTECEYYSVPSDLFVRKIQELGLWRDLTNLLSYWIVRMASRDRDLVGQDAYSKIRTLLLELWSFPENIRLSVNTPSFIQQRTGLSRSRIMQVLSELKSGEYIKIMRGRLLDLKRLPASF